jgi:hypothetical protein
VEPQTKTKEVISMSSKVLDDLIEIVGITPQSSFPEIEADDLYAQVALDELLQLPPPKPDIEQLVKVQINAEITRTKVIPTPVGYQVIVRGVVKQKILYVADVPEQSLHAAHFERPFSTFISLPADDKDDDWDKEEKSDSQVGDIAARVLIEDVLVQEFDKRSIHKCVILFVWLD